MTRSEYDIVKDLFEEWINISESRLKPQKHGSKHETLEEFNEQQAKHKKACEEYDYEFEPQTYRMYNRQYIEFDGGEIRHQMEMLHVLLANYEAKILRKRAKAGI